MVNLSIDNKKDSWIQTIQNEEAQVGTHFYVGFDKHFLQKCHYSAANMVQFIFIDPARKIIELQAPLQSSNMEDFIKENHPSLDFCGLCMGGNFFISISFF